MTGAARRRWSDVVVTGALGLVVGFALARTQHHSGAQAIAQTVAFAAVMAVVSLASWRRYSDQQVRRAAGILAGDPMPRDLLVLDDVIGLGRHQLDSRRNDRNLTTLLTAMFAAGCALAGALSSPWYWLLAAAALASGIRTALRYRALADRVRQAEDLAAAYRGQASHDPA